MTRSVVVLIAAFASVAPAGASAVASAQGTIVGRPEHPMVLNHHVPTPPPQPISRFKPTFTRPFQPNRGVVFVPSYLYNVNPTPYYPPEVSVTNYNYYEQTPVVEYVPQGLQLFLPGQLQLWNPQPERSDSATSASADAAPSPGYRVPPAAFAADVASLDAIIKAYYDVLSGPPIKGRDWNRFQSLFAQGAHLIATVAAPGMPASPIVMTADEYARNAAPLIQRGFFEKEIFRAPVEQFGRMAQVFTTYEARYKDTDPTPFQRGVISMQLMNDGTRWSIVSAYWDAERPDSPIPAKFLPPKQ